MSGNLIHFRYEYNALNQLTGVFKDNQLIAEYCYEQNGLRYKKIDYITGKTTIYIYGQGTEPIYEKIYKNSDLSNPLEKNYYLFLGTKRVARDCNGKISYYYTDHIGSTRAVQTGGSVTRLDYVPFGEDFRPASERYKFTGKEDDFTTGLYYFNARYYDPAIGRFITEDPAKNGSNWYVYCGNNPLKYVDPTGNYTAKIAATLLPITLIDGPLPIFDILYGLTVAGSAIVEYGPLILMAKDAIEDQIGNVNEVDKDKKKGKTPEDLIKEGWKDVIHPEKRGRQVRLNLRKIMKNWNIILAIQVRIGGVRKITIIGIILIERVKKIFILIKTGILFQKVQKDLTYYHTNYLFKLIIMERYLNKYLSIILLFYITGR